MRSFFYKTNYVYQNHTEVDLKIIAYSRTNTELIDEWNITTGQQILIGPLVNEFPIPFYNYFIKLREKYEDSDSVVIEFANNKCLVYNRYEATDGNILIAKNYQGFKEVEVKKPKEGEPIFNKHSFTLTWIFTPEDVAQAVDCDML